MITDPNNAEEIPVQENSAAASPWAVERKYEKPQGEVGDEGSSARADGGARLGAEWWPIVFFLVLSVLAAAAPNDQTYGPHWLFLALNSLFVGLLPFVVAGLAARGFLSGRVWPVLLLGAGAFTLGLSSTISAVLITSDYDARVTVHNIGMLIAAFCSLGAGIQIIALRGRPAVTAAIAPVAWLVGTFLLCAAIIVLVTWGALSEVLPPFMAADGPTPLRQTVLSTAVGGFGLAAILLLAASVRRRSPFLRWYGLALLLFVIGLIGVSGTRTGGTASSWAGRAAQYAGGVYLLIAALVSVRDSGGWRIRLTDVATALRQSEARFRSLFERMNEGFVLCEVISDGAGRPVDLLLRDANPAFERLTGLSRVDVLGRKARSVLPQLEDYWIEGLGKVGLTGVATRLQGRVEALGRQFAVYGFCPGPGSVAALFMDVTQSRQAEDALRVSERRYRDLVEVSPDAILVSRNNRTVFANTAAVKLLGAASAEAILLRDPIELFHEDLRKLTQAWIEQTLQGARPTMLEARIVRTDGTQRDVEVMASALADADGTAVQVVMRDVTERRRTEEALRRAKEVAEAANQAKDRFLAALSHELRTPLSPALLLLNQQERNSDLPEQVREDLATARRNIELEIRIIDDLLDLSRVTSGKMRLHEEVLPLQRIVGHAVEICADEARERGITMQWSCGGAEDLIVGDPTRLEQVFWNILKNAIKFTPPGGTVSVAVDRGDDDLLKLRVRDTGVGIAPESLDRIFAPFEQGDPAVARQFGGLGLGLAISRAIVDLHGGRIYASSGGLNQGTTLTVELHRATQPAAGVGEHGARGAGRAKVTGRLLLVEDHVDTARTLARLLRSSGHTVVTAGNIAEAITALERDEFDVLLSDLGLPDGTGYSLMEAARGLYPAMPGICMSGYGMSGDLEKSREAGFTVHLVKPVSVGQLEETILAVLEQYTRRGT